jgi:hypothetical protein
MGLSMMTRHDRVELVCSADPDVKPKDPEAVGWMRRSEADAGASTDRVTVRPLTLVEFAELSDVTGLTERWVRAAKMAVVSVNGSVRTADWFEGVTDLSVLWTLGAYVWHVSSGHDPAPFQRAMYSGTSPSEADAEASEEG